MANGWDVRESQNGKVNEDGTITGKHADGNQNPVGARTHAASGRLGRGRERARSAWFDEGGCWDYQRRLRERNGFCIDKHWNISAQRNLNAH